MALEQIAYLKEEGVDISHVSFGHMDSNLDTWMHTKVAEQGAYLCFDVIGKMKYGPESARIDCILELVHRGFGKQILISGDFARKSYLTHYNYGPGYKYIIKTWIPRLKEEAEIVGFNPDTLIQDFFIEGKGVDG